MHSMDRRAKMRIVRGILLAVTAVCLFFLAQASLSSHRQRQQQRILQEMRENAMKAAESREPLEPQETVPSAVQQETPSPTAMPEETPSPTATPEPVMLEKYADLYRENSDLVGWLSIEGMVIDYPVMQCEDDEYYLHHDFYGQDSKYGCLYVRNRADVKTPGTNFIIYGHNMKDGSMFGDLDLYRRESFFQEHPVICFDTLYEERTYEILAVFRSQVYNSDDDVFRYYQFYEAQTREEFDDFYENIKELSLYDTGVTAEFGDSFLTLSTCAYHVEDGRFAIVAKKLPH